MIFLRMRLVELKWGLAMLLGCAVCGASGIVFLCLPYLFLIFALAGLFGIEIPVDLPDVFPLFFALGVAVGAPRVARNLMDGFRSEIRPLRQRQSEQRLSEES